MDVKQAVEVAKQQIRNIFGAEIVLPPSLEEVWLDKPKSEWCVTLGIQRGLSPLAGLNLPEYKTVRISAVDGGLISIRNREIAVV